MDGNVDFIFLNYVFLGEYWILGYIVEVREVVFIGNLFFY